MLEDKFDNRPSSPVTVVIHRADQRIPLPEGIHHNFGPDQTLVFFQEGYHRTLDHREEGKSYHPEELVDVSLLLSQVEVLFRYGPNLQPEYIASPKKETHEVRPGPHHTAIIRGIERFDVFSGETFGAAMRSIEAYEQRIESGN